MRFGQAQRQRKGVTRTEGIYEKRKKKSLWSGHQLTPMNIQLLFMVTCCCVVLSDKNICGGHMMNHVGIWFLSFFHYILQGFLIAARRNAFRTHLLPSLKAKPKKQKKYIYIWKHTYIYILRFLSIVFIAYFYNSVGQRTHE
ncbi:unnamed protein product [Ectocarpus sp. 12 AP-2014]